VAAHPAAEVHEMDGHPVGVPVDEMADLVDVGGGSGRGVDVDDEAVPGGLGEDAVQLGAAGGVRGPAAQQEAQFEGLDPALARQLQCLVGAVGVLRAR